jgi:hypothetical protein
MHFQYPIVLQTNKEKLKNSVNTPMDRFLGAWKQTKKAYDNETGANDSTQDYLYKYYNSVRPHSHNLRLSPNQMEAFYWKTPNWVAKKGWPLQPSSFPDPCYPPAASLCLLLKANRTYFLYLSLIECYKPLYNHKNVLEGTKNFFLHTFS